jgi:CYTH domain-containing protein
VRQAFLRGREIHELAESVHTGKRARFTRFAEANGARAEEKITEDTFQRFWSIAPFRIEKTRYQVRENGRTFWIDQVRGASLVLAETDDEEETALPDWLDSLVKRDVTGVSKYEAEALARANARQRSSLGSSKI